MLTETSIECGASRWQEPGSSGFSPQEQRGISDGREYMDLSEQICRHPEDAEACRQSLIQAWREESLTEHCV